MSFIMWYAAQANLWANFSCSDMNIFLNSLSVGMGISFGLNLDPNASLLKFILKQVNGILLQKNLQEYFRVKNLLVKNFCVKNNRLESLL